MTQDELTAIFSGEISRWTEAGIGCPGLARTLAQLLDARGYKVVRKPRTRAMSRGEFSARMDAIHGTPFDKLRR